MNKLFQTLFYQQGLTLLEVVIALFILSTGTLGLLALQAKNAQLHTDNQLRSHASLIMNDLKNRIRANSSALNDYVVTSVDCNASIIRCSDHIDSNGIAQEPAPCSASNIAKEDLHEIACGFSEGSTLYNSSHYLPNSQLNITSSPKGLTLQLSYNTRQESVAVTSLTELFIP